MNIYILGYIYVHMYDYILSSHYTLRTRISFNIYMYNCTYIRIHIYINMYIRIYMYTYIYDKELGYLFYIHMYMY